jgi:hypothetical protein
MANQDSGFFAAKNTERLNPGLASGARSSQRGKKSPLRRAYEAVAIVGSLAVLGAVTIWEVAKEWRR